jgi:hypothetical protein
MKWLIVLIVIGGLGYLGYTHQDEVMAKYAEIRAKITGTPAESAATPTTPSGSPSSQPAPSARQFESKIADAPSAPGEKHVAPPGIFYMTERVSATTANGIVAVSPAEQVTLLGRPTPGRMKVMRGSDTFEIKESQATNDLDVAREVEKKEFVAHGGKL